MKIYKPNPKTGKMEVFESDQNSPRYHVPPRMQSETRQSLGEPFPKSDFRRRNQTYMMGDTAANPIIPERNRTYDFTESVEPIAPQRNRIYSGGEVVDSLPNPQNTYDPYSLPVTIDDGLQLNPVETVLNEAVNIFDDEGSGYDNLSFGDAFNKARENGETLFNWKGKVYNTRYKDEKVIEQEKQLNDIERAKIEWHGYSKEEKAKWNNDFDKWYEFITHKAGDPVNEVKNQKQSIKVTLGGIDWGKEQYDVIGSDKTITTYNFGEGPLPASYFEIKDEIPY